MDLLDWLDVPVSDAERATPDESLWLDAGTLDLVSGNLLVCDPASVLEPSPLVVLKPHLYEIHARLVVVGDERRIARLRVVRTSGGGRGKCMGKVSLRSERVGFADDEAAMTAIEALAPSEQAERLSAIVGVAGVVAWREDVVMPVFRVFSRSAVVYELVSGDRRMGAEVVVERA